MAKILLRNGNGSRSTQASKYDAHNSVLSKTYGVLADLRRELSDSKAAVAGREELLQTFATCADSQRAWLLLEDYFEKLSLSRKDFPSPDWWPRLLAAQGRARLEEVAFLFLRAKRTERKAIFAKPPLQSDYQTAWAGETSAYGAGTGGSAAFSPKWAKLKHLQLYWLPLLSRLNPWFVQSRLRCRRFSNRQFYRPERLP